MQTIVNTFWTTGPAPTVTVITPFYNRTDLLCRPFSSLLAQTYKDFEFILIDDGSTEDADSLVKEYMDSVTFPMMYVKKENGGVHTARNIGIRRARGRMAFLLDADDGMAPNALERFMAVWDSLPDKETFREVISVDVDENGRPLDHHRGINRMDLLKANLFPEPEGVKFVNEMIVFGRLSLTYKSFVIDEPLYIYHINDVPFSICQMNGKITVQKVIDNLWNSKYMWEHRQELKYSLCESLKYLMAFLTYRRILSIKEAVPAFEWVPMSAGQTFVSVLVYPITSVLAFAYIKKRM